MFIELTIIWILLIIFLYCCFVVFFRLKLNNLEYILQKLFKKRNYKIISIFYATKDFLNKHDEIFQSFIELKTRDFSENNLNFTFENKLQTYKDFHKEMDFIFKICETNWKLKEDSKYNYIKTEILNQSQNISKKYNHYKKIEKKYRFHHKISKFFIIWLFLK